MKPPVHSQAELAPFYARYRAHLCAQDCHLDARLRAGAMQRVAFETLSQAFDVILLDAYGVLNLGNQAIAGAAQRVSQLQKRGTPFLVVSNNASQSPRQLMQQFASMALDIHPKDIISSGMAIRPFVARSPYRAQPYYWVGTPESAASYAPDPARWMVNTLDQIPADDQTPTDTHPLQAWRHARYILLCSNRDYYGTLQQQQVETLLASNNLPILLANPDLTTPTQHGALSAVAGYTAAQWTVRFNREIVGIGKPFPAIFSLVRQRFPQVDPERFLMVGDTLDTDILGGAAQGFRTCLTCSGAYAAERDRVEDLCISRGICPDFIVQSIAT